MTTKPTFKSTFFKPLFAAFLLTLSSLLMGQRQSSSDFKDFKITIEKNDKELKMKSSEGSAWIDLSFNLPDNNPQAIDEYGMTQIEKVSTLKDPQLADYLFTITRTKEGITLTGIEGTAWKELSFPLTKNGKQAIDQFGMTD